MIAGKIRKREAMISETAGTPLVGMSMLAGNRLTMDVVEGGDVAIDALPQ